MSYEKVKSVSFDKKNKKIWVTSACVNCTPLKYTRWEYGDREDFKENIKKFFVDTLEGNFKFLKSCKWYEIVQEVLEHKREIYKHEDVIWSDVEYNTKFNDEMNQYLAETYLIPLVLNKNAEITPNNGYETSFIVKCEKAWDKIENDYNKI